MLPLPNIAALIVQFTAQPAVTTADYDFHDEDCLSFLVSTVRLQSYKASDLDVLKCQRLTAEQNLPLLEQ